MVFSTSLVRAARVVTPIPSRIWATAVWEGWVPPADHVIVHLPEMPREIMSPQPVPKSHLEKLLKQVQDEVARLQSGVIERDMKGLQADLLESRLTVQALQSREKTLLEENTRLELEMEQLAAAVGLPRVIVLLDGDGVVFTRQLMKLGRPGGLRAALQLSSAIAEHMTKTYTTAGGQPVKFVLSIYCFLNTRGLGRVLEDNRICTMDTLNNFISGFNQVENVFAVDVGYGKEACDARLRDILQSEVRSQRTARVYFSGCHDAGYIPVLESLMAQNYASKLALIPAYLMLPRMKQLGLPVLRVDDLWEQENLARSTERNTTDRADTFYTPTGYGVRYSPPQTATSTAVLPAAATSASATASTESPMSALSAVTQGRKVKRKTPLLPLAADASELGGAQPPATDQAPDSDWVAFFRNKFGLFKKDTSNPDLVYREGVEDETTREQNEASASEARLSPAEQAQVDASLAEVGSKKVAASQELNEPSELQAVVEPEEVSRATIGPQKAKLIPERSLREAAAPVRAQRSEPISDEDAHASWTDQASKPLAATHARPKHATTKTKAKSLRKTATKETARQPDQASDAASQPALAEIARAKVSAADVRVNKAGKPVSEHPSGEAHAAGNKPKSETNSEKLAPPLLAHQVPELDPALDIGDDGILVDETGFGLKKAKRAPQRIPDNNLVDTTTPLPEWTAPAAHPAESARPTTSSTSSASSIPRTSTTQAPNVQSPNSKAASLQVPERQESQEEQSAIQKTTSVDAPTTGADGQDQTRPASQSLGVPTDPAALKHLLAESVRLGVMKAFEAVLASSPSSQGSTRREEQAGSPASDTDLLRYFKASSRTHFVTPAEWQPPSPPIAGSPSTSATTRSLPSSVAPSAAASKWAAKASSRMPASEEPTSVPLVPPSSPPATSALFVSSPGAMPSAHVRSPDLRPSRAPAALAAVSKVALSKKERKRMRNNSVHSDETGLSLGQIVQMLNETPFDTATGNVLSASTQSPKDEPESYASTTAKVASLLDTATVTTLPAVSSAAEAAEHFPRFGEEVPDAATVEEAEEVVVLTGDITHNVARDSIPSSAKGAAKPAPALEDSPSTFVMPSIETLDETLVNNWDDTDLPPPSSPSSAGDAQISPETEDPLAALSSTRTIDQDSLDDMTATDAAQEMPASSDQGSQTDFNTRDPSLPPVNEAESSREARSCLETESHTGVVEQEMPMSDRDPSSAPATSTTHVSDVSGDMIIPEEVVEQEPLPVDVIVREAAEVAAQKTLDDANFPSLAGDPLPRPMVLEESGPDTVGPDQDSAMDTTSAASLTPSNSLTPWTDEEIHDIVYSSLDIDLNPAKDATTPTRQAAEPPLTLKDRHKNAYLASVKSSELSGRAPAPALDASSRHPMS